MDFYIWCKLWMTLESSRHICKLYNTWLYDLKKATTFGPDGGDEETVWIWPRIQKHAPVRGSHPLNHINHTPACHLPTYGRIFQNEAYAALTLTYMQLSFLWKPVESPPAGQQAECSFMAFLHWFHFPDPDTVNVTHPLMWGLNNWLAAGTSPKRCRSPRVCVCVCLSNR